jgi:hypothetical protein
LFANNAGLFNWSPKELDHRRMRKDWTPRGSWYGFRRGELGYWFPRPKPGRGGQPEALVLEKLTTELSKVNALIEKVSHSSKSRTGLRVAWSTILTPVLFAHRSEHFNQAGDSENFTSQALKFGIGYCDFSEGTSLTVQEYQHELIDMNL